MPSKPRQRRPHNQLKTAVVDYLRGLETQSATTQDIIRATRDSLDNPPQSSYRSALQDERVFRRVSRGCFQLAANDSVTQDPQ